MTSANARLRIVVDTNVFISGMIARPGGPLQLLEAWRRHEFDLLTSETQRAEIACVLQRPRIARTFGITEDARATLLRRIDRRGIFVNATAELPVVVRDPKDVEFLRTALEGHADYLVTGDKDLLVLADQPAIRPLRIVTIRDLLDVLAPRE